MAAPLVSVLVISFNHARYIAEAIQSVVTQEFSSPFQIVLADDCSSDNTIAMAEKALQGWNGEFTFVAHSKHVGASANVSCGWQACNGSYIAILEGDDYWLASNKLQRQVDLLQQFQDSVFSAHEAKVVDNQGQFLAITPDYVPPRAELRRHLLSGNFLPTSSVMYRREILPRLPDWFLRCPATDWPLHVLYSLSGDLAFIPEPLGIYRMHSAGAWSAISAADQFEMSVRTTALLKNHVPDYVVPFLQATLARYREQWVLSALAERKARVARRESMYLLRERPNRASAALAIRSWFPLLAQFRDAYRTHSFRGRQ